MIRIGIIGGAGYTAGELCRLLLNHPEAEIVFVNSESNAGNLLTDVHEGLYGETDLRFTDRLPFEEVDVVFFCFGHGKSTQFLSEHYIPADIRIIDLAQDFRLAADDNDYVYGLPELNRNLICGAQHIANPGCFATCIQLGLLPLAEAGLLQGDVSVNAITGSTGAGVKPAATTHFSWRSGNMSIYKPFSHQHVPEIKQSLRQLQPNFEGEIEFIPYRGDFPRGIFATEVLTCDAPIEEIETLFADFYSEAPFTHYVSRSIDMKQVINTNKCLIHAEKHGNKLLITSCIDNLLKGASGQALQNMNLMFGLEETTGLRLKPVAF
ncbi:MAG: N-acetyl-gamma-glutamyl-phosphate reductase [Alloprevotella sp.]